jgi:1,4-alpha-glucan branching enzyme
MSVKKQFLKTKPVCKVTFKITAEQAQHADSVRLVGEFNYWDVKSEPMKRLKDGSFTKTVNLEINKQHQFRYLLDNNKWENDWHADAYTPSTIGIEENSIVAL